MRARSMLATLACAGALAVGTQAPARAQAQAPDGYQAIDLRVVGARAATIKAYLKRPAREGRVPVVVAMHGCGGIFNRDGRVSSRHADWADRLVAAGYAVLMPDSFTPRGIREICTLKAADRPLRPRHRADDAAAAIAWVARQDFADPARLALLGWSHGGSSVLHAVEAGRAWEGALKPRLAIAFYPGCRVPAERAEWAPEVPLTILIGDADDWTPPAPCRAIAARNPTLVRLIEYPGAVHGFDAPASPRRTRTDVGLSARGDGRVEVGTDPAARAKAIEVVAETLAKAFAAAPTTPAAPPR